MKLFLKILFGVILVAGIACLAVYCIALAKDMTFVDYIKSWFEKAPEISDTTETVASFMFKR